VEEEDEDDGEDYLWCEPTRTNSLTNDPAASSHIEYENRRLSNPSGSTPSLPSKLILVRHGQSEGNVDEKLYTTKPDNAMRLTDLGWEMARAAGKALRDQIPKDETVHFIVSPYARTVETFHGLCSAWVDPNEFSHISDRCKRLRKWYSKRMAAGLTWHEDPRIREQDFGNYQVSEERDLAISWRGTRPFGPLTDYLRPPCPKQTPGPAEDETDEGGAARLRLVLLQVRARGVGERRVRPGHHVPRLALPQLRVGKVRVKLYSLFANLR